MSTPTTGRHLAPGGPAARRAPGAPRPVRGPLPGGGARQAPRGPGRYEAGDLRRHRGLHRLHRLVTTQGLAVFDGVPHATDLLRAAATVMTVFPHPDAGPDGVTTLTDLGPAGRYPGAAGFSRRALPPHTDRAGIPTPPGLLMVTCAAGLFTGGASLITDGAAVHAALAATAPATLEALHRSRSALFGGSAGHLGAVFTPTGGTCAGICVDATEDACEGAAEAGQGRCRVRLRLDELATFSPDLDEHLPILHAAIARHTLTVTLTPGRGYLLDNHRWLHARTSYTGARTLYRLLGTPLPELGIRTGIPLPPAGHDPLEQDPLPVPTAPLEPNARRPTGQVTDGPAEHPDRTAPPGPGRPR